MTKLFMLIAAAVFVIATATTGFCASLAEGTTLYGQYCGCHGSLANSSKKGATPSAIQGAIDANRGGMGSLSSLTPDQVLSISIALGGATAPPPPSITLTSSVSGSTVSLSWTIANLTGVSSYRVLRNNANVGTATAMSYTDSGLANGTYSYEVDAVNSAGTVLAKSNVRSVTVNVLPATITLSSSVSGSTATLSWTIANLTGVSSYRVLRNNANVGTATALSYTNSGLANGTYSYEVDAVNSAGTVLAKSNVVSATVNVAPAPVATITLTSSVSGSTASLNWTLANLTGVSSYRVLRNGTSMGSTTALSYTNSGLANGTYSYEVDAMNSAGAMIVKSNVVSVTVNVAPPAPAPTATITLTSSVSGSTATLRWATANLTNVSSYRVLRNGVSIGSTTALSYTNSGLANGTYRFEVDAVNSAGTVLARSNVLSLTVNVIQPASDGATLYGTYCAKCHGTLANSRVKGESAQMIQNAITNNLGGMRALRFLTATQIQAIASALGSTSPSPAPAPGKFTGDCLKCHKADGTLRSGVRGDDESSRRDR